MLPATVLVLAPFGGSLVVSAEAVPLELLTPAEAAGTYHVRIAVADDQGREGTAERMWTVL